MLRFFLGSLPLVLSFLVLFGAPEAAFSQAAPDCSTEKSLKSPPSATPSELSFQNRSAEKRRIYWIDQEGDRKFYGIVEPGNVFKQPTLENHAWVVTDDAEKCLYTFVATAEPRTVSVGEAAAAVIAPPPAGGQQPIAQAAPPPPAPPPVVQAPPPVVQAPPPVAAAPPPAAAPQQDPQTAMAEVPRVSPVEQFDLRGLFRISPRTNPSIAINSEAAGTIFVMNVKPEWTSGQWAFEAVPGLPFVRIRNEWKKTYLTDVGGKLRATAATPDADEAHWTFEPVDGTSFVQFRNRETDRFLIVVGGAPALADDLRQDQENLSEWKVGPAGRAAVAAPPPPPRNSAYDAALANCRELGGYWTGSSCRAAIASRPLVCPRGYVWSEDVGECQWDGGSCPPWQIGPGGVCMTDISCRGGVVRLSRRGYPACYCPLGYVTWGDYPRLSCVPSVAHIAPLLIGGAAIAILGANQGRPTIGQVYGNKQFCPPGKTGTPPNCVAAATCPAPLVGTPPNCLRLVPRPTVPVVLTPTQPTVTPGVTPTPAPTPTAAGRACNNNELIATGCTCELPMRPTATGRCFVTPGAGQACLDGQNMSSGCHCMLKTFPIAGGGSVCASTAAAAGTTTPNQAEACPAGYIGKPPTCQAIRCYAGAMIANTDNCACNDPSHIPVRTMLGQIVCAAKNTTPTTGPRACNVGEVPTAANCQCKEPLFIFDGKCAQQTLAKPGTPTQTRSCNVGEAPGAANCECRAPLFIFDGKCAQQTIAKPGTPTQTRSCNVGEAPGAANCECRNPLQVFDGKCQASTTTPTQPVGGPPLCTDGQNTASGCRCAAPLTVLPGGKCGQPTKAGAPCLEGQNIAATGCVCGPPLKQIENGFCGRLFLNETKPLAKGGTCAEGADIKATGCQCNMNTVDAGGGKFICSASRTTTTPAGGPPLCTDGQNTASGCRCAAPLTVLPGGKCGQPTKAGAQCLEGQNIAATGCVCGPPLKQIENGFCGRLLLNETKPLAKGGTCAEGADIKATGCQCNMKTVDAGGGKFICSANPAPPSGGRLAPGQQPAPCPAGTTGTPPNCKPAAPVACPTGQVGTPPNCRPAAPVACPAGQVGTPPNCRPAAPVACPTGQVGTPPNCRPAAPVACPAGQVGTPPNCRPAAPVACPAGQVGTPPNCRPAPAPAPQPQGCAPPKKLNAAGQCV